MGKRFGVWALTCFAFVTAALLAGCGGGGASAALGPNTSVFVTDAPTSNFDQVWVRVYQVDAVGPGGTTTVFSNSDGVVIDVASLNDGAQRFAYLGSGPLPSDTTSISLTLGLDLALVPTGGDAATMAKFSGGTNAPGGTKTVIQIPYSPSAQGSIVIDFDLANWQVDGDLVTPVIGISPPAPQLSDVDRQDERPFLGSVQGLQGTPPDQHFELVTVGGHRVPVAASADTVIFGPDGAMADLANGQRVLVFGKFDPSAAVVQARAIQILGDNDPGDIVVGEAFDPNPGNNSFLLRVHAAWGFLPSHRIITMSTPDGTTYLAPSGEPITKERFYAALASGLDNVIALGAYDPATNLFTVRIVKLHHDEGTMVPATAAGEILETDPLHMRFALSLSEWSGFDAEAGDHITVATGVETQFFAPDGTPIRAAEFYRQAGPGTKVGVRGLYEDGVIRAAEVKVVSWSGSDMPDEASGLVRDVMPDQSAFTIVLRHWTGFDPPGDVIRIQVANTTVIVDDAGHTYTADEFFHQIGVGGAVSAFGQFDVDHFNARKIVVHQWDGHVRFVGVALEWDASTSTVIVGVGDGPAATSLFDHIKVVGGDSTQYFAADGTAITKDEFFAGLTVGHPLGVEGVFDGTVVHASSMKLL